MSNELFEKLKRRRGQQGEDMPDGKKEAVSESEELGTEGGQGGGLVAEQDSNGGTTSIGTVQPAVNGATSGDPDNSELQTAPEINNSSA
jgi:hypothetical protein